jgi:hypothetical protein
LRRLALLAAAVTVAGCGSPSPDLFEVTRSGADRNANVRLLVSDAGTVTCNDAKPKALTGPQLLEARDVARELSKQAALAIQLEPEKDSTLRYEVKTEGGNVAFSDTSRGRPKAFNRLVAFTADVAENICGIER